MLNIITKLFGLRCNPVIDLQSEFHEIDETDAYDKPYFAPSKDRFFIEPEHRVDKAFICDALRAPVKNSQELYERIALFVAASNKEFLPDSASKMFIELLEILQIKYSLISLEINQVKLDFLALQTVEKELIYDSLFGTWLDEKGDVKIGVDRIGGGFPFSGLLLRSQVVESSWRAPSPYENIGEAEIAKLHLQAREENKKNDK